MGKQPGRHACPGARLEQVKATVEARVKRAIDEAGKLLEAITHPSAVERLPFGMRWIAKVPSHCRYMSRRYMPLPCRYITVTLPFGMRLTTKVTPRATRGSPSPFATPRHYS